MSDDEQGDDAPKNPALESKLPRYGYAIVIKSDIVNEAKRKDMVEICQIACEKHSAAEKPRCERDNQAAAEMIKVSQFCPECVVDPSRSLTIAHART